LAVIEAMAAGLPIIISDKVNIWREVESAGAGKVVPCEAGRFTEAILDLLDEPAMARQMGQKGQALVRNEFYWPDIAVRLEETYAILIERYRRRMKIKR
jgi:glycosyltransferase involved in cell wall biosynthesis